MDAKSEQFKVGDVVTLKSGGPKMTVRVITGDLNEVVNCNWITNEGIYQHGLFHHAQLTKVEYCTAEYYKAMFDETILPHSVAFRLTKNKKKGLYRELLYTYIIAFMAAFIVLYVLFEFGQ